MNFKRLYWKIRKQFIKCWICHKQLTKTDKVVNFMGFAHFDCFAKQMEENKKREAERSERRSI